MPALKGKRFYDRLFTPRVTLWQLLFQRVHPDHTLDAALSDARAGGGLTQNSPASWFPTQPPPAAMPASGSRRSFWPLQGRQITKLSSATRWHGRVITLLDGSTVRLRPYGRMAKEFPPQRNQHQQPYWCLVRVVVSFCARSGAALDCALGSMRVSEQVLAGQIILATTAQSLFMEDRNFGVFRIAQAARQAGQAVLLRLTDARARKLLGRALRSGDHPVHWSPTRQDQLPPEASREPVTGRLLVVQLHRKGFRSQRLCLFTTLPDTTDFALPELVRLYGQRWPIELNLRYLKAQMDLAQLEAKSPDQARKEWLAGWLAYNLIRAAQLCAALHKGIAPLTLSFSAVRRRLEDWLRQFGRTPRQARARWTTALIQMGRCRLPRRRKPRPNEPRAQRHLRLPYAPLYGSRATARKHLNKYASKS